MTFKKYIARSVSALLLMGCSGEGTGIDTVDVVILAPAALQRQEITVSAALGSFGNQSGIFPDFLPGLRRYIKNQF